MILYLDTSVLVKRYFREDASEAVISLWAAADELVTSSVAFAETLASFHRKKRESEANTDPVREALTSFRMEWPGFIRVEVNEGLNPHIARVIEKHPLRGFDAIHLASALLIHEQLGDELLFASFDHRLMEAAEAEGLSAAIA